MTPSGGGTSAGAAGAAPPAAESRPPILLRALRDLFAGATIGAGAAGAARAALLTGSVFAELTALVARAAADGRRSLVLLGGVPCSGKTVLGLRLVHSLWGRSQGAGAVGDGAVGRSAASAVYLSGNAALAEVLQYDLRALGSGTGAPVRVLKDFVRQYTGKQGWVPPQHVIVVDDLQPLSSDEQVAAKHGARPAKSDPDTLVAMAERIPEWSVLIVVTGDAAGPASAADAAEPATPADDERERWRAAARRSSSAAAWVVHEIQLETPLRSGGWPQQPLRVVRDLSRARQHLRERFDRDREARFGLLASSRDQDLVNCGVANGPALTGRQGLLGPWCCDGEDSRRSGRHLEHVVTEFGVRGLELDAALVAWGTDLVRVDGVWTNTYARVYARSARVKDPLRLRRNAYRSLLSRGLDETVVYVPERPLLDETAAYLAASGLAGV